MARILRETTIQSYYGNSEFVPAVWATTSIYYVLGSRKFLLISYQMYEIRYMLYDEQEAWEQAYDLDWEETSIRMVTETKYRLVQEKRWNRALVRMLRS